MYQSQVWFSRNNTGDIVWVAASCEQRGLGCWKEYLALGLRIKARVMFGKPPQPSFPPELHCATLAVGHLASNFSEHQRRRTISTVDLSPCPFPLNLSLIRSGTPSSPPIVEGSVNDILPLCGSHCQTRAAHSEPSLLVRRPPLVDPLSPPEVRVMDRDTHHHHLRTPGSAWSLR
ncbi:hypothetical protein L484_010368 [Morus notabilis]|uniref:Uncharacterized protein n=1 Tax=Morus notabilis TaxID=981085 RepID=W9RNR5_9ROSA|nr:hypothetical protein L484_010368 [Morus notabilis]